MLSSSWAQVPPLLHPSSGGGCYCPGESKGFVLIEGVEPHAGLVLTPHQEVSADAPHPRAVTLLTPIRRVTLRGSDNGKGFPGSQPMNCGAKFGCHPRRPPTALPWTEPLGKIPPLSRYTGFRDPQGPVSVGPWRWAHGQGAGLEAQGPGGVLGAVDLKDLMEYNTEDKKTASARSCDALLIRTLQSCQPQVLWGSE
ncbi:uncharacterized protein LOC130680827 isoform X2 [Manis pentadactyla]|uniref:uncharacterized protein LOC130680827 isoform X2 n=1 Tax=Manis pentadactyla TaxID=143292 RepID=UPI00255C2C11|nr:uncharacterized protein LOC130680827 isoform X2 [Manis pentadactyla]